MKQLTAITIICILFFAPARAQKLQAFADSIRQAYHIPELGYAVVSADSVLELQVMGVHKRKTHDAASLKDRFRIGSNTKAITGFIAAQLVDKGKLSWDTKFFEICPELRLNSEPAYYDLTLQQLLSFRTKLFPYTYTYDKPTQDQFSGDEDQQRYQFIQWFLQHPPVQTDDSINFSNLGYVAAGLMLEKASGKSYKELVIALGAQLHIDFHFGQPNADPDQPWGHDAKLSPEPPQDDYKLNWLLAAGNINVSLPDYAKFIQLQLQGLQGKSKLLTKKEFNFLHYGLERFSIGWFSDTDEHSHIFSHNTGNPGTFLTSVYVYKDENRAYILFANAQTDETEEGLDVLYDELKKRYQAR